MSLEREVAVVAHVGKVTQECREVDDAGAYRGPLPRCAHVLQMNMSDAVVDPLQASEPAERGRVEHRRVPGVPDQTQVGRVRRTERRDCLVARCDVALVLVLERKRQAGVARARSRTTQRTAELGEHDAGIGLAPVRERSHDGRGQNRRSLERTLVNTLLRVSIIASIAFEERRGDHADVKATCVELRPHRVQGGGSVVDDLDPVDRAELHGTDPKLCADVERPPEPRVDLVRDHAQLHARASIRPDRLGGMATALSKLFGLENQVAVVTGASGALGSAIARGLAAAGARVGLLARRREPLEALARDLGESAIVLEADVLDADQLHRARATLLDRFGRVDALVNAAGGNLPDATVGERSFFELPPAALDEVVRLNFTGTVLPSQVFGAAITSGSIINVSSMAAHRALTRVVGYGAAKAAVENLTRWLAVELAPSGVRVNAIAPGFFIGDQNRALLLDESGALTARGERIVAATPAGRFGEPDEVAGTVIWLCSAAAAFVTGAVIPIDGGFGAFGGV